MPQLGRAGGLIWAMTTGYCEAISTVRSDEPLSATMTSQPVSPSAASALSIVAAIRFSSFSVLMMTDTAKRASKITGHLQRRASNMAREGRCTA
ncbi:hypothetical protein D3C72_2064350 [compost metagenome]